MEMLKGEFEKKDSEIEALTEHLDRMTAMYEDALSYKRRYDQLLQDYNGKQVELDQLNSELCQCRTQLDVFEVELQRTRNDSSRQEAQLDSTSAELEKERSNSAELANRCELLQR